MADSTLTVKVLTDTTGFTSGLKTASGEAETFKSKIGSAGKALGAMALAGGAALGVSFLKGSIDEMRDAEKVAKQTAAGIASTGGAANVTAGHVEKLAGSLSSMAGVDDELIQTGANMLLTFTNVKNAAGAGNNVFDQATEAALNLSAKGFGSVESASVMLGKALNDPIKGITALGKSGVTFTEQQKEQIKTLTETGDVLGAQKIILGEVQKQVGGAAKAAADPVDKLKVSFGNLQESVGKAILPILDALVPVLISLAQWFERNAGVLVPLVAVLGGLAAIIAGIVAVTKVWTAVQTAFNLVMAANPIVLIILGIAALVAAIVLLYTKCEWFRDAVGAVWDAIKTGFNFVLDVIKGVFNWVKDNWPLLLGILTGPIGLAIALIVTHWDTVKAAILAVWDWIKSTWSSVYHLIVDPIANAVGAVLRKVGEILDWFKNLHNKVQEAVSGAATWLLDAGKDVVRGLWDGIKSMAGWIADKVKGLAKTILGPFAKVLKIDSPSRVFFGFGQNIVQGLANGIRSSTPLATRAIADLGSSLVGPSFATAGGGGVGGGATAGAGAVIVNQTINATEADPYIIGRIVIDEAAWALKTAGR
jgi:hypothetical protein